jgi:molybdenum cofactor biosynthesis enzyme MoaA
VTFIIPIENNLSYESIPRNKDLKLTIANRCNAPSRQLVVDWKGDCFVCSCEAWLPISVGKIDQFTELSQVWASSTATALQADINSGAFTHCAVDRCGIMNSNLIDQRYVISINIDESCNLRCPSCRTDLIMTTAGENYDRKLAQVNQMVNLLERFDQPCHIVMSGNGDPLASSIMRPLIHKFQPKSTQTIRMFTNGLLLKKQLINSPIINNITQYFISIDAGSESVYERVRLGGRWPNLLENLDWLQQVKSQTQAEVLLKFVLQQDNWHDMENFADLCERYGFMGVIHRLEDWGTWNDFNSHDCIGNRSHAMHDLSIKELQRVHALNHDRLQFGASLSTLIHGTMPNML